MQRQPRHAEGSEVGGNSDGAMLAGPSASSPFTYHPALIGREAPMAALADSVRRLIDLTVTNDAPADILEQAIARIEEGIRLLADHVPDVPLPRFVDPATSPRAGEPRERTMHDAMPYDPVIGHFNPLALPVTVTFAPPLAIGVGTFTTAYEGGPGWVHGAAIAATFDIVLTAANQMSGVAGPTVWLTVRFRRPTLVGKEARFEAEIVSNDGKRVKTVGRLSQDGEIRAEAEGEFAVIPASRLLRLGT